MITVIATGFDARRRQDTSRAAATERSGSAYGVRQAPAAQSASATPPARDFLDELERQRTEIDPDVPRIRDDQVAVPAARSVGEAPVRKTASYDADDLEIPSFLRRR